MTPPSPNFVLHNLSWERKSVRLRTGKGFLAISKPGTLVKIGAAAQYDTSTTFGDDFCFWMSRGDIRYPGTKTRVGGKE